MVALDITHWQARTARLVLQLIKNIFHKNLFLLKCVPLSSPSTHQFRAAMQRPCCLFRTSSPLATNSRHLDLVLSSHQPFSLMGSFSCALLPHATFFPPARPFTLATHSSNLHPIFFLPFLFRSIPSITFPFLQVVPLLPPNLLFLSSSPLQMVATETASGACLPHRRNILAAENLGTKWPPQLMAPETCPKLFLRLTVC